MQLILRNSRPLRLTEAGRVFYEQALQIINRLDQLKTATRQIGLQQRETVSIGFVPSTLYGGLPMLVRKLRQHYPDVDIQPVELTSTQQIGALKSGRIDVGFGRIRGNDSTVPARCCAKNAWCWPFRPIHPWLPTLATSA